MSPNLSSNLHKGPYLLKKLLFWIPKTRFQSDKCWLRKWCLSRIIDKHSDSLTALEWPPLIQLASGALAVSQDELGLFRTGELGLKRCQRCSLKTTRVRQFPACFALVLFSDPGCNAKLNVATVVRLSNESVCLTCGATKTVVCSDKWSVLVCRLSSLPTTQGAFTLCHIHPFINWA